MREDFYRILGIPPDSSTAAVKRAYRRLALRYHPDRANGSPGAEEKFRAATAAYRTLRDPDLRARYDRTVRRPPAESGEATSGPAPEPTPSLDIADALEIFVREFGAFSLGESAPAPVRGGGRPAPNGGPGTRTADRVRTRVPIEVTLEEVASGAHRMVRVPCASCSGEGSRDGGRPSRCPKCGGGGRVRQTGRSLFRPRVQVVTCPGCEGAGKRKDTLCTACGGEGVHGAAVGVRIPPGVSDGDTLSLRGAQGAPDRDDVVVVIRVAPHPRFRRDGADLSLDLRVSPMRAANGTRVDVPTIRGAAPLRVPADSRSGTLLRMPGHGLPRLHDGSRGDQVVRVVVPGMKANGAATRS